MNTNLDYWMRQIVEGALSYPTSEDPKYIDKETMEAFKGFNLFTEEEEDK